jgi:arylsulfatase A-like enzyme
MLEEMDKGVGRLMQTLNELGLSENTCIIFFSDNGGVLNISSNAPFSGGKGQVWEGGHRVPAIISWAGKIETGIVCDIPCISLDIMPTVLDLVGIDVQPEVYFDGISLYTALMEGKPLESRLFFWNTSNDNKNTYAVRMANWKLVGSRSEKPLLFNLSNDKGEKNNLSSEFPELVKKMQKEYHIWKNDVGVDNYRDK